jgi:hypothetical protein
MTTALSATTIRRLRIQGFTDDEACLAEASLGLRIAPALCALVAALGTALASPSILFALAATALLGAAMPFHPFDLIYNYGLRFWLGRRALPPNGASRRFGCLIATVWLSATALAFLNGQAQIGYVLGALFVAVAGLLTVTHICIPSLIYNLVGHLLGRPSPAS